MTETSTTLPSFTAADLPDSVTQADVEANRFTESGLLRHKREGQDLALRARWIALAVIIVMLPFLNPNWNVLYYQGLLVLLALIGWAQRRIGQVGRSGLELLLLFVDLLVVSIALLVPNPFDSSGWPTAMVFRFESFQYFFVILAAGTLSYNWRTVMAIGTWTTVMWTLGVAAVWWFGRTDPDLTIAAQNAFGAGSEMAYLLDPNALNIDLRVQQGVVFLIVTATLAVTVRRFNRLLLGNAALERERANLSRYFSPNVVEDLSRNDEPLKQIRSHDVAVLFVDIVGFTAYASERPPQKVIETLRAFHGRMEAEVFRQNGTLDKYMGDGLMATFGTPFAGDQDATNALRCARAMVAVVERWNTERAAAGDVEIQAAFGLDYGPVVLGDIGANRLEFAVIGNTVNIASRMEKQTRLLSARLAISDRLRVQVLREADPKGTVLDGLTEHANQHIRGLDQDMTIWTLT